MRRIGNERPDARRDGRTRLVRPNFSGANGNDMETFIFPVQLTTSSTDNHIVWLMHAFVLLFVVISFILDVRLHISV